jgi:hypothetical protein
MACEELFDKKEFVVARNIQSRAVGAASRDEFLMLSVNLCLRGTSSTFGDFPWHADNLAEPLRQ